MEEAPALRQSGGVGANFFCLSGCIASGRCVVGGGIPRKGMSLGDKSKDRDRPQ